MNTNRRLVVAFILSSATFLFAQEQKDDWEQLSDGSFGQATEFRGVDEVAIPAYIRKPPGAGPFAVVVMLHGGRYGREATIGMGRAVRSPMADFIQAGWAIYSIDYRPSNKMLLP